LFDLVYLDPELEAAVIDTDTDGRDGAY